QPDLGLRLPSRPAPAIADGAPVGQGREDRVLAGVVGSGAQQVETLALLAALQAQLRADAPEAELVVEAARLAVAVEQQLEVGTGLLVDLALEPLDVLGADGVAAGVGGGGGAGPQNQQERERTVSHVPPRG